MPQLRHTLSRSILILSLSALASPPLHATPQQERMRACNKEAKEKSLKGEERKAFMSSCLSAGKADKADAGQTADLPSKASQCRDEAKEKALKGEERKAFIKACKEA
ncbi:PsiF family protein [Methyloversatilis thermotolerans]|uniref:PsiF family protein n=1 Tax=Methyloversatilis thermotolerans TaxID=1346290 RepID=UPI000371154F|nr:PsiF family protein [Methyloversatilis thermotolerans]